MQKSTFELNRQVKQADKMEKQKEAAPAMLLLDNMGLLLYQIEKMVKKIRGWSWSR